MSQSMPFAEALEALEHLSADEQEALLAIVRRRLAERGRKQVVADVEEARGEFQEGGCQAATPDELLREIGS